MITIVNPPPIYYSPVYSMDGANLTWVLDSDLKMYCSMKYVANIWVNGSSQSIDVKLSPNGPNGICSMSLNRIFEDYVSWDITPDLVGFAECLNSEGSAEIYFAEETDGTIGCTGLYFSQTDTSESASIRFWNGTVQYKEGSNTGNFDYCLPFIVSTIEPGATSANRFLTNGPNKHTIGLDEQHFLHYIESGQHTSGSTGLALKIDVYPKQGTMMSYFLPTWFPGVLGMKRVSVGPAQLNQAASLDLMLNYWGQPLIGATSIIDCNTDRYVVGLSVVNIGNPCYPGGPTPCDNPTTVAQQWLGQRSELIEFKVLCTCERYTPNRLFWLNRRGGIDSYTFRLESTKKVSATSLDWERFTSRIDPISYEYGYSVGDRGKSSYGIDVNEIYTAVSTWQSEKEHQWLEELYTSPVVWRQVPGTTDLEPIVVTQRNVEIKDKKGIGNRLLSHTIEWTPSYNIIIQRG